MATTTTTTEDPKISDNELSYLLSRLGSKPGVQSVLILLRENGAIIRATGAITRPTNPDHPLAAEYAAAVYKFMKASDTLVEDLDGIDGGVTGGVPREKHGDDDSEERDDIKILRFRTKRRELVVVPDAKFMLIVFHDTPVAL
ncbi:hypothetical protein BDD12DRAFT_881186 [Trichophaea hybrida]|nr:hypothetical protein BDD12DRAFT_881186 [Trichophaea hybrida]